MAMAELYLRDGTNIWRTPPATARPDDPPFIIAVNIAAGWVYEIGTGDVSIQEEGSREFVSVIGASSRPLSNTGQAR